MSSQLPEIVIYGKSHCPYCHAAVDFFKQRNLAFTYIEVSDDKEKYQEMLDKTGGPPKTVPQIIINGTVVGGFSDLTALDDNNELNNLL